MDCNYCGKEITGDNMGVYSEICQDCTKIRSYKKGRIEFRLMDTPDLDKVYHWRISPHVSKYLATGNDFNFQQHWNWFHNRKDRIDWIILLDGKRIGVVNSIHINSNMPELGLYIGDENLWGKGIGKRVIELIEDNMREAREKMKKLYTPKMKDFDDYEIEVWEGIPYVEIVKYAREKYADLIIMAHHTRTPTPEMAEFGSTLEQVVLRATCPVASVNRPDKIKGM